MERKHAKLNTGKKFEEDFQKSVPSYSKIYRLQDPPQSFIRSSGARFSHKNPFDYFLWDMSNRNLYALELKSVQGNSISFERSKEDNCKIHYHQIKGLLDWSHYGVICGFVVEFRNIEATIFLGIQDFMLMLDKIDKKSFSYADLNKYEIPYVTIPQKLMKTRYKYDIASFLNTTNNIYMKSEDNSYGEYHGEHQTECL